MVDFRRGKFRWKQGFVCYFGVKTLETVYSGLYQPDRSSWPILTRSGFIKRGYETVTSSSGWCRNSLWVVNVSFVANMDCFRESEAKRGRKRRVYILRNAVVGVVIESCREYDLMGNHFLCYLLIDKYLLNK